MNTYSLVSVTAKADSLCSVLANLTKMYCCEWSLYTGMEVDDKGRYMFEQYLPLYWQREDRAAFLLRCEKEDGSTVWAGFALLDRDFILHKDADRSMAEFFVLPVHRCHGAGRYMARALFDRFPGHWEIGRNPKNTASVRFWDSVIADYTGGHFSLTCACPAHRYPDGICGDVFSFRSPPSSCAMRRIP